MELKLEKLNKSYSVKTDRGKILGTFHLDTNGFYYFWEDSQLTGCWGAWELRKISDLLDEVNKPHRDEMVIFLERNKQHFK